ncbi:MAG: hypothetical protein KC657_18685 [Myxococcales bacterium]|nr:hypothetical protein [Myxococcales bacterium]
MLEPDPTVMRDKYTQEVVRLESLVEDLARERTRLKWYVVAGLVLAPFGLFWGALGAFGVASLGVVTYFVALYLNRVHHEEYEFHLERARGVLEGLDEASPPAEPSS